MGPWQRIQYPGSQISNDPAGNRPAVQPYTQGIDGSTYGHDFDTNNDGTPDNPLPLTTGQSNGTPNAVRWAYGQLTYEQPEFAWLKIKIADPNGVTDATGCPLFYIDTFGGDAGGDSGGKDHIWRYYDPNSILGNACVMVGKPATRDIVKSGDIFQYNVKVYNLSNFDMHNVVVRDLLPSGVTLLSAVPAQNTGPNPLVWNVGTLQVGQAFSSVVTVKATSSGVLENQITVTSDEVTTESKEDTTSGSAPLLVPTKSASPTAIAPGGTVQYTIQLTNVGSGPSGSPTLITEYLPSGFTYLSLNSVMVNGASYTGSTTRGGTATVPTFSVPAGVNAGQKLLLTFTAKSNASINPGPYCNAYAYTQNGIRQTTGALACVSVGGGRIGDTVFRDWNGNGVQDPGEEGIAGVTIALSGDATQTATTDANGNYLFTGLVAGNYVVTVTDTGGKVTGYTNTSVTSPASVTLATDEQRMNVDFGYLPGGPGIIGDQLFEDVNNNGLEGASDPAITAAVTVWLYEDTNGDGLIGVGDTKIMTTTTSAVDGTYSFTGLAMDVSYLVQVDETDPDLAAYFTPEAFKNTTGALKSVKPADFVAASNNYVDADFGYFRLLPSSIGDEVCIDANNDGSCVGEELLPGVTVNLYLDGDLFATTTTSITGTYGFTGLGPGNYTVIVDNTDPDIPGGYFPSVGQYSVSLGVGENRTDIDFPFVQLISKQVDKTKIVAAPATLSYTITANYPGSELLTDVIVTDTIPAGTTYVDPSVNAGGVYSATTNTVTWELGSNTEGTPAYAGSASGTNAFRATQDTKLQLANPTNNYGNDTTIQLTTNDQREKRALVKFNVSSLSGQTVSSATLRFYVNNNGSANTRIDVYPLTQAWDSTGTNWTKATASTNWTTAGGRYDATNLLGSFVPSTNNQYYTVSGAAVNALVQSWINSSTTNFGVVLVMVGDVDEVQIRSMEDVNSPTRNPELVVTTGAGTTTRNPSQDTFIDQRNPTNINAAVNPLAVLNPAGERRSVVQWDVSSLPPAAEVVGASVKFYFTGGNSNVKLNLYRPIKTWDEASATWMLAQTASPWAMPGGDYTTSLGGFQAPSANNTYKSYSSAALATLVQGWIDGSITNQGLLILPTSTATGAVGYFRQFRE